MAYFSPNGSACSGDADFILRAVRDGLIDSIHSWGDFNSAPPDPVFLRKVAEDLSSEFTQHDLRIKIWINHGSPNNRQNLKARLQKGYQGDDPESPYYTADLLHRLGVKFYWWSEVLPWPLSCERTHGRPKIWARLGLNLMKNIGKIVMGRLNQMRQSSQLMGLAQAVVLRDRNRLIAFTRFNKSPGGVWELPTRHSLRYSLSPTVLSDLVEKEGYAIVYTHLGLPRDHHGTLFPKPDKDALTNLAREYYDGKIWVAPTGRLLTYWLVHNHLIWKADQAGEKTIIHLLSLNDPVTGPRLPDRDELSGLCFYTARPAETIIRMGKSEFAATRYPPDHSGQAVIGFEPAPNPDTDLLYET